MHLYKFWSKIDKSYPSIRKKKGFGLLLLFPIFYMCKAWSTVMSESKQNRNKLSFKTEVRDAISQLEHLFLTDIGSHHAHWSR